MPKKLYVTTRSGTHVYTVVHHPGFTNNVTWEEEKEEEQVDTQAIGFNIYPVEVTSES